MAESPELIRISLNLHEEVLKIQGVIFNSPCPLELNFDHLLTLKDLPFLNVSESSSHLIALLYEVPESFSEFSRLSSLVHEGSERKLAVFSEPSKDFSLLYIIVQHGDPHGLSSVFNGARFGIFLYHYKEVLGEEVKNYISYIRIMKIAKANFIKKTQKVFFELEAKKEEKKHYEEMADYLSKRSGKLKEELETAKLAIQQLNYQLEKKKTQLKERQEQNFECLVCKASVKNIVFLPCGHIVVCKNCLIETMKISPNTILCANTNPIKCPSCKNPVKESKEVHF